MEEEDDDDAGTWREGAQTHTTKHGRIQSHIRTHRHTDRQSQTDSHTQTQTHIHIHSHTRTQTQTHTNTQIDTYMYTHTQTHTHTDRQAGTSDSSQRSAIIPNCTGPARREAVCVACECTGGKEIMGGGE